MLASLFRGNSSQRSNQYIDSVTDDAHTRSLLFGQSHHVLNLTTSPPTSPFGSPALRPSSYDDQGGLELEEKDIRILIAQDAHGDIEKPLLLFDSRRPPDVTSPSGKSQPAGRSPLPANWQGAANTGQKAEDASRARSSTFSGSQSSWSKAARSLRSNDDPFLHCMFGVKYFKKTDTSTKLHIIPAKTRHTKVPESLPRANPRVLEQRRAPLTRAHTSGEQPTLYSLDTESRDCLLITRLFQVTLDDGTKVTVKPSTTGEPAADKPPKLVENKLPQYAIGFVLQLPHPSSRPRSSSSRFAPNLISGQSLNSATSSYGSDMQSSWTFLDAIPDSLSSSINITGEDDRRLDMIVDNWDVILRAMAYFEYTAAKALKDQLQKVLSSVIEPQNKVPKEKSMQRINQRMIAIHDIDVVSKYPDVVSAAADVSRRIAYAMRIPRVVTGLGITAGHWTDEARMLYRSCGGRQQNFFLFNLLTAFLGNHMQWLERLAPEWYRNQFQASNTKSEEPGVLASRTIIVSEHKGLARRLVYVLASFLPGRKGIEGLGPMTNASRLALSLSPSGPPTRQQSSRRSSKPFLIQPQTSHELGTEALSTSASSHGSYTSTLANRSPRKSFVRKYSNTIHIKSGGIQGEIKTGAGTTSTIMPQSLQTPAAYISSVRDGYFSESAIVETNDSIATADLSKVLHKASSSHRRTSSVSSRWGSLVSGISEIWSSKPGSSGDCGSSTTISHQASPTRQHKRSTSSAVSIGRRNPLQMMVDELEHGKPVSRKGSVATANQGGLSPENRSTRIPVAQPRLHVDDKDGVVDVELDLPGFLSASTLQSPQQSSLASRKRSTGFTRDGIDSICSFRSMSVHGDAGLSRKQVNVGGYLRRHHEDFALHAVRPYDQLEADIKRTMLSEPTPRDIIEKVLQETSPSKWVSICTTLVADTKTFTVRRLTLRRRYEVRSPDSAGSRKRGSFCVSSGTALTCQGEEIADEVVMEFDATLTDAIEKLLNVGSADPSRSPASTHVHSRNVSLSSGKNMASTAGQNERPDMSQRYDGAKVEQRDLVIGALEDVVRSVNDNLNRTGQHNPDGNNDRDGPKQENALREGVKKWMINVEHAAVW